MYAHFNRRLTPLVKHLSKKQKEYLKTQVFFLDDPDLSFPGFREDLKDKTQTDRDKDLWIGACPPEEPKKRSEEWYKKQQSNSQVIISITIHKILMV